MAAVRGRPGSHTTGSALSSAISPTPAAGLPRTIAESATAASVRSAPPSRLAHAGGHRERSPGWKSSGHERTLLVDDDPDPRRIVEGDARRPPRRDGLAEAHGAADRGDRRRIVSRRERCREDGVRAEVDEHGIGQGGLGVHGDAPYGSLVASRGSPLAGGATWGAEADARSASIASRGGASADVIAEADTTTSDAPMRNPAPSAMRPNIPTRA